MSSGAPEWAHQSLLSASSARRPAAEEGDARYHHPEVVEHRGEVDTDALWGEKLERANAPPAIRCTTAVTPAAQPSQAGIARPHKMAAAKAPRARAVAIEDRLTEMNVRSFRRRALSSPMRLASKAKTALEVNPASPTAVTRAAPNRPAAESNPVPGLLP